MKKSTKQIQTAFKNLEFLDLSFIDPVKGEVLLKLEKDELNLREAIELFVYSKELINSLIEKDPTSFEKVLPFSDRQSLINLLSKLQSSVNQIKGNISLSNTIVHQNAIHAISYIIAIHQIIVSRNLEYYLKKVPRYISKLNEVTYLRKRYKELEQELRNIPNTNSNLSKLYKDAELILSELKGLQEQSNLNNSKVNAVKDDIEKLHQTIKLNNQSIIEYVSKAKVNFEQINEFFAKIDRYDKQITSSINKLNETQEQNSKKIKEQLAQFEKQTNLEIETYSKKTDEIINENQQLQENILDLLGKAIGTNLYKSFNEKAISLRKVSFIWLALLGISIIALTYLSHSIVNELIKSNTDFQLTFYFRITVLLPVIYSVYFFASQYKNTSRLQQEYDFKSAVAVSLNHFKDVIENTKECEKTQAFLTDTVNEIFSSPSDSMYGKRLSEKDVNDHVDNIFERVIKLVSLK